MAQRIEAEVLQPFCDYDAKLARYRASVAAMLEERDNQQDRLTPRDREELRELALLLNLTSVDTKEINCSFGIEQVRSISESRQEENPVVTIRLRSGSKRICHLQRDRRTDGRLWRNRSNLQSMCQVPTTGMLEHPPLVQIPTTRGWLVRERGEWREKKEAIVVQGYREKLGAGEAITMVQIPTGEFLMGSLPYNEGRYDDESPLPISLYDLISELSGSPVKTGSPVNKNAPADEGPRHRVTLPTFFLGQTPITQAQWQVVASWPKVERDLKPDPAKFKEANRPVEQVSWVDALEFCRRLSQRSGRDYTLPSEAQWEYACRAGTTTPFAFGETVTSDLANYRGTISYGSGPKGGEDRMRTTAVRFFPANEWGLHDMHGNVREWCLDHWHDSYYGAPTDGSAWGTEGSQVVRRLLRGGSWNARPKNCRSAYRFSGLPMSDFDDVGFRICYLPQG
jgi:formylglycine-generating enzyme required for sulfatase activity